MSEYTQGLCSDGAAILRNGHPAIHLEPCPFCGHDLEQQHRKYNPFARCITENCMGGRLPLTSLDLPSDIERWNRRGREQALAAHQEDLFRELSACQAILYQLGRRGEVTPQYAEDARSVLYRTPTTSLARRDALKRAEALEWAVRHIKDGMAREFLASNLADIECEADMSRRRAGEVAE